MDKFHLINALPPTLMQHDKKHMEMWDNATPEQRAEWHKKTDEEDDIGTMLKLRYHYLKLPRSILG